MGQSTDGQICYGIDIGDELDNLPWEDPDHNGNDIGDIEEWWPKECGYKPTFDIWTDKGEYVKGITRNSPEHKVYYDELHAFKKAHPLPVSLVNTCSCDYPSYIVALPSTVRSASRGSPESFNPADLVIDISSDEYAAYQAFVLKYGIAKRDKPQWYLSSLWC